MSAAVSMLYGVYAPDLEAAKAVIDAVVDLPFQMRDSSFYSGDYYLARTPDGASFRLFLNRDVFDGEYYAPDHADATFVLLVKSAGPSKMATALNDLQTDALKLLRGD